MEAFIDPSKPEKRMLTEINGEISRGRDRN